MLFNSLNNISEENGKIFIPAEFTFDKNIFNHACY